MWALFYIYMVAHLVIKVYVNCIINTLTWWYINIICHCGWCHYHNCWANCEKYQQHTVVIHCVYICVWVRVCVFDFYEDKVKRWKCARPNTAYSSSRVFFYFKHVQHVTLSMTLSSTGNSLDLQGTKRQQKNERKC